MVGNCLDGVAGGAAYVRFASCVLWLEPSADDETARVMTQAGDHRDALINRRLRILKARSGRGTGHTIGLRFDGHTLNTEEVGMMLSAAITKRSSRNDAAARAAKIARDIASSEDRFPL